MSPTLVRVVIVLAVVAVAYAAGRWWSARDGRVRAGTGAFTARQLAAVGLDARDAEALALLLGSPTCAPCVTVKRLLREVATQRPGFRWVDVDAAEHLDLAAQHHVLRVPTLFVLAPDGRILARTSGVPAIRDLHDAIDRVAAAPAA